MPLIVAIGGGPKQRRLLELNPGHEIFIKLRERFKQNSQDATLEQCAALLYGYALLAEGSELPDPVRFNRFLAASIIHGLHG